MRSRGTSQSRPLLGTIPTMRRRWAVRLLAVVAAPLLATGCANTTTVAERSENAAAEPAPNAATQQESKYAGITNSAQQPDPSVTAYCNEVPMGQACHAVTASPSDPNESPQRNCTPSVVANRDTSCAFAENAFYQAFKSADSGRQSFSLEVYSPVTHKNYELGCEHSGRLLIGCVSSPTSDGIYLSFPQAAIVAYTELDAEKYAASHDVGHPPAPFAERQQDGPAASGPPVSGDESSESGGTDEVGSASHAGDQQFCEEHTCIGDFTAEPGTVVACSDGTYSHSGGISGACSDHGGEANRE